MNFRRIFKQRVGEMGVFDQEKFEQDLVKLAETYNIDCLIMSYFGMVDEQTIFFSSQYLGRIKIETKEQDEIQSKIESTFGDWLIKNKILPVDERRN